MIPTGMGIRDIFSNKPVVSESSEPKKKTSKLQPNRGELGAGSPQANYEARIESGIPLSDEEILDAKQYAESIGTTFSPRTGFGTTGKFPDTNGESSGFKAKLGGPIPSEMIPADVREIELRGGPRSEKEAKRMARFQSSTMGRNIYGSGESDSDGGRKAPHISGTGKTAPMQSQDQLTDSRGQMSENQLKGRYRPMSGEESKKFAANLGTAWGNVLDQKERGSSVVTPEQQAKNAGVTLAERNAAVEAGQDRINSYLISKGRDPVPSNKGPKPAANPGGTPEFFYAEGNPDGSVSSYRGKSASVAEARGREVNDAPRPQVANSPVDKDGNPKKFRARI